MVDPAGLEPATFVFSDKPIPSAHPVECALKKGAGMLAGEESGFRRHAVRDLKTRLRRPDNLTQSARAFLQRLRRPCGIGVGLDGKWLPPCGEALCALPLS